MEKSAPTRIGLVALLMRGWPGRAVGVGTGTVGLGVVATHIRGVGVGVGVAVRVRVGVCVGVRVAVCVGVAVGVLVGVPVGVAVGVLVNRGVAVGVEVGVPLGVAVGPMTVNPTDVLAARNLALLAKLAVKGTLPPVGGVRTQEALPFVLVTPVQDLPSSTNLSDALAMGAAVVAHTSDSDAVSVLGLPTVPLFELRLRVQ